MHDREPVLLSWSGGKDSALALHALRQDDRYEVVGLLTSVSEEYRRISHHGVRLELLERQAAAIGVPLDVVFLPSGSAGPCTNSVYEEIMERALVRHRDRGVTLVAHGDIFLQDLREYRERNLAKAGLRGLFPLWQRDTAELLRDFIDLGFRAHLTCVEAVLGEAFAGRAIDDAFLEALPSGVDPCGERGEYHSFVWDGPIFERPVPVEVGVTLCRDGRYYADLLPGDGEGTPAVSAHEADIPPVC